MLSRPISLLAALVLAVLLPLNEASALERHVIILIDRSGSMSTLRMGSTTETRFKAAINMAVGFVNSAPSSMTSYYSVWSFEGTSYTSHLAFTTNATTVKNTLNGLVVGSALTPLAYSACAATDALQAFAGSGTTVPPATKLVFLASDGEENNSPAGTQCAGPNSAAGTSWPNYTVGSWQAKVYNKFRTGNANNYAAGGFPYALDAHVFYDYITFSGGSGNTASEYDVNGSLVPSASASLSASYFNFLQNLAGASRGSFTAVSDSTRAPVYGDTNGDFCVNDTDYNLVLANYNQTVPPANPAADLNKDRVVNYDDYSIVINNYGTGTGCGGAAGTPR